MDPKEYQDIIRKKRTKPRDYSNMKPKACNCGKNLNINIPNPH